MENIIDTKVIIDRISILSDNKGLSINKALIESGVGKSVVDNLKKGSMPNAGILSKIADYFNVSADYLLGKTNNPNKEDVTFDDFTFAMYEETKDLTEKDKEALLDMAKIFKKHLDDKKR